MITVKIFRIFCCLLVCLSTVFPPLAVSAQTNAQEKIALFDCNILNRHNETIARLTTGSTYPIRPTKNQNQYQIYLNSRKWGLSASQWGLVSSWCFGELSTPAAIITLAIPTNIARENNQTCLPNPPGSPGPGENFCLIKTEVPQNIVNDLSMSIQPNGTQLYPCPIIQEQSPYYYNFWARQVFEYWIKLGTIFVPSSTPFCHTQRKTVCATPSQQQVAEEAIGFKPIGIINTNPPSLKVIFTGDCLLDGNNCFNASIPNQMGKYRILTLDTIQKTPVLVEMFNTVVTFIKGIESMPGNRQAELVPAHFQTIIAGAAVTYCLLTIFVPGDPGDILAVTVLTSLP